MGRMTHAEGADMAPMLPGDRAEVSEHTITQLQSHHCWISGDVSETLRVVAVAAERGSLGVPLSATDLVNLAAVAEVAGGGLKVPRNIAAPAARL